MRFSSTSAIMQWRGKFSYQTFIRKFVVGTSCKQRAKNPPLNIALNRYLPL